MGGNGNHIGGNGNYLHSHGNLFPKVLCCDELIKLLVLMPDANAYCVGGKRASVQHCWSPAGKATNQSESRVDQRVAVSSQQHEVKL